MSVPHSTRLRTRLTGKLRPGRNDRPIDRLPLPTLVTAAAREPLRRKSAVNALALRPAVLILALSANAEQRSENAPTAVLTGSAEIDPHG